MNSLIDVEKYQENMESTIRCVVSLADTMKALTHKTSKLRDCGDEFVRNVVDISEKELVTVDRKENFLRQNLQHYAQCLSIVEDHRDSQVTLIKEHLRIIYLFRMIWKFNSKYFT